MKEFKAMRITRLLVAMIMTLGVVTMAISQPSLEGKGNPGGKDKGMPRFELGRLFPPPLREQLKLSSDQLKELSAIESELKSKLDTVLSQDQKKTLSSFVPGAGGKGSPMGGSKAPRQLGPDPRAGERATARVIPHGKLKIVGDSSFPFKLVGDATEGTLGDTRQELNGGGIRFFSNDDKNQDGMRAGQANCVINSVKDEKGRWYRIRINALAQEGFAVEKDNLYLKVEFFKDEGKNPLDYIKKSIYPQIELERKSLADAGTNKNLGPATWRSYSIDVRTPFPDVDTLGVSFGFANGTGKGRISEFWVNSLEIIPIPDPADYVAPANSGGGKTPPALKSLVKLGGRWYYEPRGETPEPPKQFDSTNVDRLYYLSDRLETPFVGNTSAWLRRGSLDRDGNAVEQDQFIPDSVVISFTSKYLVMKSKNLPNHPTAVFPDRTRYIDGNPNVIREQRNSWNIPLEPKENPKRIAMTMENKQALPMGPIGVAVNGVVFFNPFDHIAEADAVWRLDRCCGHPSPNSQYHYHKYPVCVNTPWSEDGERHSPLIGFAFDGYPIYGPYEGKGILAKDSKDLPLNEFNLHIDEARGPHYHVTPGMFPHIIGGYWGEIDPNTRMMRKGPPKN
jgi:hypothetical protein